MFSAKHIINLLELFSKKKKKNILKPTKLYPLKGMNFMVCELYIFKKRNDKNKILRQIYKTKTTPFVQIYNVSKSVHMLSPGCLLCIECATF